MEYIPERESCSLGLFSASSGSGLYLVASGRLRQDMWQVLAAQRKSLNQARNVLVRAGTTKSDNIRLR